MAFDFGQYPTDGQNGDRITYPPIGPGITAPGGVPYEQGGITGGMSTMPMTPTPPLTWDPNAQQIDPGSLPNLGTATTISPGILPPGSPTQQSGTITMQQFNQAWLSSPYPGTVDGLKQFYAAHPEYAQAGITLGGSKGDKVYGPGGSYWGDAVVGAGAGGLGKSGLSGDTGGSAGGYGTVPGLGFGSFVSPFTPPTAEDALNSPGLQFALSEANRMGQNSAAAKGTLLNGRFQQALNASNIQNALQGYQGVFDRSYQTQTRNQDAPFQKYYDTASLGQKAATSS